MSDGKSYFGVTFQDAVLSSVRYYNRFGNSRANTSEPTDPSQVGTFTLESHFLSDTTPHLLDGIMTIPVCWNEGGEFISSSLHHMARNYPCMCGQNPVHHPDNTFDPNLDETGQFLIASGLESSDNWIEYCSANMECTVGDMAIPFKERWPTYAGEQEYQFSECEDTKCHGFMGVLDGVDHDAYDTDRNCDEE